MHSQYPTRVNKPDVDQENTHQWLSWSSVLKSETEGFIVAAQDQSLATKSYHNDGTDHKCRMCREFEETIDNILTGCLVLAKSDTFKDMTGQQLGYIYIWKILQHYHFPTADNWYDHKPETVMETEGATILWDMPVSTDKQIHAN